MVHGRAGFRLEALKLSFYIGLPVAATILVNDPSNVRWMIDYFQYIRYPPSITGEDDEPLVDKINREFKRRAEERGAVQSYQEQVRKLDDLENERRARLTENENSGGGIWTWFGFKK